ncbi:choice-of-anchor L domain-containing protein [Mesonia sp.]|uniref:choice-of-anchor L domain-containing protein n=1 Tax=Mesonia sp. TaxID=1960830 RepID=UPI003F9650A0
MKAKILLLCVLFSFSSLQTFAQNVISGTDTNVSQCTDNFYDNGGPNGGYADIDGGGTEIVTICSDDPNLVTQVEFTSFMLAAGDVFNVYDGDSTGAPLMGAYTNGNNPGTVFASGNNASGCLTFEFVTDGAFSPLAGWKAVISCREPCEPIDLEIINVTPGELVGDTYNIGQGQVITFEGEADFLGADPTGATYEWGFDNGQSGTGATATTTYNNTGVYDVVLTLTTADGCMTTVTQQVEVFSNFIDVDDTYTDSELVDLLISGTCANYSNISSVTNTSNKQYGYFTAQYSDFPFQDGIVISTGFAANAEGPNASFNLDNTGTGSDPDLDAELNTGNPLNDRAYIQFDFVPYVSEINFNFIFASEEYRGTFACTYSDSFAFLLTDSAGNTTNLAVLPNTTTPITVPNVHPANNQCGAVNEQYFGQFNGQTDSAIGFEGQTVALTATGTVNPGETYTIKLVVADERDTSHDSAVFLEAGSFELGANLGTDVVLDNEELEIPVPCEGDVILIDPFQNVDLVPGATFTWFFNGEVIPGETGETLEVTEEGTYGIEVFFTEDCTGEDEIFVEFLITPDPLEFNPVDIIECNPGQPSLDVNLTQNDSEVLGNQDPAGFIITYHNSQQEAEDGVSPIIDPAQYNVAAGAPEVVFVRIEGTESNDDSVCYQVGSFEVSLEGISIGQNMEDLEECDDDNDGDAIFDLTENEVLALDGLDANNYTVTYYETQNAADLGTPAIPAPTAYENVNNNPQEIFVRVQDDNDEDCNDTGSFFIESFAVGEVNPVEDMEACSLSTPIEFNLTTNTPLVLGSQDPADFAVTYFATQAEANAGTPAIADPANYSPINGEGQTIYIRIENVNNTTCYNLTNFNLIVNEVRIGAVTDKEACDGGNTGLATFDLTDSNLEALDGQSPLDYEVTYYETQAAADAGTPAIADPTNYENVISNPQPIYVRVNVDGDADCYLTESFMIEATASAPINAPTPLVACDTDNDGFYNQFILTDKDDEITGGNPAVTVSYHLTQSDADNGVSAVNSPYANVVPYNQTIYVRVEDTVNGCVLQETLELEVYDSPQIVAPEPLEMCDDDLDEQAIFDLTQVEEEVLDGLDPNSYEITYHDDEQEAEDGVNPIGNAGSYENASNPQTIWIRVTDPNTPTGCYNVVELELIVNPLPVAVQPTNLELCDDELSGSDTDELSVFDLTVKDGEITAGDNSIEVIWYETPADLQAGIQIPNPTEYTNIISTNQTVVALLVDENGCSVTITLTLVVNPLPSPTPTDQLEPYELCDDDNDGFVEFDLDTQEDIIANGEADVEITYYATPEGAESGLVENQIGPLYENVQINQQTIYARATNIITGCYRWVSLDLVVTPLPEIEGPLEDIFACDATGDTFQNFDITQNEEVIYGTQDTSLYTISYYESETNAIDEVNPISAPTNYSNGGISPLTIWVRLEDNDTECFRIASFDLITGETPEVFNPQPLEACDDSATTPTDEIGLFDLTQTIPEITNEVSNLEVFFYESVTDMDNDNFITPADAYQNIDNPQTLQVKVVSDEGCEAFTTLTLVVNPNPSIEEELDPIEVCDIDNDGFADFDLEAETVGILNGEPNVSITYHTTLANAENGVDAIDTTELYTNVNINIQTIYVRAENTGVTGNGTNCYVTRPLELIVIPSPVLEPEGLEDLYVCDDASANGFAVFDLTQNEDLMFGDQDPTNLEITYHEDLAAAENGTPQILVPTNYTNIVNPQMIWVRIENTETGCIDVFVLTDENTFMLYVEEIPELTQPTPLQVCDDDYENDPLSQVEFDLTVKESEILDMDPVPDNYVFTYYASAEDQASGTPIDTPEAYVNAENPQTIFIEVADTNTENSCINEVTLTIEVLPLPTPSEESLEALRQEQCDDDNDGVAADPFDLTQSGDLISDGENVVISYYKTEEAANEEDAAELIGTPEAYVNEPAYNTLNADGTPTNIQLIYARVDSGAAGNFCYVLVPFEIIVYPEPVLNPAGTPFGYTLCEDGSSGTAAIELSDIAGNLYDATFEADADPDTQADPTVLIPLLDQDPATNANQDLDINNYIFTYYFSLADAQAGANAIPNGFAISDDTTIWVEISNSFGCVSDEFGEILVQVEPRPSIDDTPLVIDDLCSDEQGGNTATIDLTQYSDQINPGAPADTQINYYASMQDYLDGLVIETPSDYTTESNPQTIIAEVIYTTSLCESATVKEITLEVNETPTVDITSYDGTVICYDSNPATEVIGGNYDPVIIDTGLNELTYDFVWTIDGVDQNNNSASFEVTEPGLVVVEVTNTTTPGMCSTSSEALFFENNPPEFQATIETISFNGSHSVLISNVTGNGDYEFSVDNGPWTALGEDGTLTIDGLAGGEHEIIGRDQGGCGATLQTISFIDYPEFFTPNEDGYNDRWNILGLSNQLDAKIYIFDRYGKLLKQLSPNGEGWDGTFNGTAMPSNDYWFRVEYTDIDGTRKEFKANFTLKR